MISAFLEFLFFTFLHLEMIGGGPDTCTVWPSFLCPLSTSLFYVHSGIQCCWIVPHIYFCTKNILLFIFLSPPIWDSPWVMSASIWGRRMPVCLNGPSIIKEASQGRILEKLHIKRWRRSCWQSFKLLSHRCVILYRLLSLLQGKYEGVWIYIHFIRSKSWYICP